MGSLLTSILLVIYLAGSCAPQNADDFLLLTLEAIAEGQSKIVQKLEDLQTEISMLKESQKIVEENLGNLQADISILKESQKTMEENLGQSQKTMEENLGQSQKTMEENLGQSQKTMEENLGQSQKTMEENLGQSQKTMEENLGHLQADMSILKESQKTMEENLGLQVEEILKCATRDQLDAFKNTFVTEQEVLRSAVQQCSTRDQIITFQDLLEADECEEGSHNCSSSATCINPSLYYQCYCLPGYSGDGFTCEDINECESDGHKCHPKATCTNTKGSYTCRCKPYYDGDGYTCNVAESKCESPSHVIPGLGCLTPVREEMSWEEAQDNCHRRGGQLIEGIEREHLELLKQHFYGYLGSSYAHIGLRGGVYVTSRDPVSSQDDRWGGQYPVGSDQKKNDCGQVYLNVVTPYLIDYSCSDRVPSLCQLLY